MSLQKYKKKPPVDFVKWVVMMDENHTNWLDLDRDVDLLKRAVKKDIILRYKDYDKVARSRMLIYLIFGL